MESTKPLETVQVAPPSPQVKAPLPQAIQFPSISPQPQQSQPASAYEYASFGRRFVAILIDGIIFSVLGFILGIATVGGGVSSKSTLTTNLIIMFLNIGYAVYFIGSRGQTLGKMAMKIKVVNSDTFQIPGYGSAFLREFIGKLVSSLVLLLGYFWVLWDEKKQSWHDKIAHTIVIKI